MGVYHESWSGIGFDSEEHRLQGGTGGRRGRNGRRTLRGSRPIPVVGHLCSLVTEGKGYMEGEGGFFLVVVGEWW